MADDDTISLRPITLRPGGVGGANPFAQFGKGSGFGIKSKKAAAVSSSGDDTSAKSDGERVKYSKSFLLEFMERYNKCPVELQHLNAEFVIQEEAERDQQRAVLQKVAEELDDRDWRTRDSVPAAGAGASTASNKESGSWEPSAAKDEAKEPAKQDQGQKKKPAKQEQQQQQQQQQPTQQAQQSAPVAAAAVGEDLKIVRATDVGREAYRPGATVTGSEKSIRQIKGILNKLTPEKFERLLQQLLEVIGTAELLQQTITLVFENAVEQPTFCAMYADLCLHLSKELPTFPAPDSEEKPVSFHQILLNTCQDEFEGTEAAREQMLLLTDESQRNIAERAVKKRTLGNMRLISELYKQDMVKDWIMSTCIEELLEKEKNKTLPPEDNIEAAAEMIATAGSKLSKSENRLTRNKLDDCFKLLAKYEQEKALVPRVKFLIKDLVDLKKSGWVARREVFTAKKLEEVRAQAEAELGMVSSNIAASLPTLPAQQRMGAVEDFALIPPLRGDGVDAWAFKGAAGSTVNAPKSFTGSSALLGDYQPMPRSSFPAAAPAPAASSQAAAMPSKAPSTAAPAATLPEDDLRRKAESLLSEYCQTLDKAEASTCVRELDSADFMPKLVEIGLEAMMNSMKEKEVDALEELLLHLQVQGLVKKEDIVAALSIYTEQLEDLSLDVPKAPGLLGRFVGSAIKQNVLAADVLPQLLAGEYGTEPKRAFAGAAFVRAQAGLGDAGLHALCTAAGVAASKFLQPDEVLDAGMCSVEDWLKAEKLTAAVPL